MSVSKSSRPFRDEVPEPSLVLLGCRPLTPPPILGTCPVCKGMIGQPRQIEVDGEIIERPDPLGLITYCGQCDAMSPANESRCRSARVGLAARSKVEEGEQQAKAALRKMRRTELSEKDRRLIWNGYRGTLLAPSIHLTNRAKVGRDWLRSIGQTPDFSLKLNNRGAVVGRIDDPESNVA